MATQERSDAGDQLAHAEGLCDVVVCAELKAHHAIGFATPRSQHQDRNSGVPVMPAHLSADLKSVHAGQHQVEHQQVWFFAPNFGQYKASVGHRGNPKALFFEVILEQPDEVVLVFNNKNFFSHDATRRPQALNTKA